MTSFLKSASCYSKSTKLAANVLQRRNNIFDAELAKKHNKIGRIEKIEVKYNGNPEPCILSMNKYLSTPHNVAQREELRDISEWVVNQSALALVNSHSLWDMHRPLEEDCEIEFCTFTDVDPYHVNKAFWRTCSFLLGHVIQHSFQSGVDVQLHSFPSPHVASGSFVHEAKLSVDDWRPSSDELRCLSAEMVKLSQKALPIQRLEVDEEIASRIFSDNAFKLGQIPDIASNSVGGKLSLYRVGSHIDISKGPMVANTSFINRCSITAVHRIEKDGNSLYRFQGLALPRGLMLNHFAYRILEERSSKLSKTSFQIRGLS